jgi:hypothetical protein
MLEDKYNDKINVGNKDPQDDLNPQLKITPEKKLLKSNNNLKSINTSSNLNMNADIKTNTTITNVEEKVVQDKEISLINKVKSHWNNFIENPSNSVKNLFEMATSPFVKIYQILNEPDYGKSNLYFK